MTKTDKVKLTLNKLHLVWCFFFRKGQKNLFPTFELFLMLLLLMRESCLLNFIGRVVTFNFTIQYIFLMARTKCTLHHNQSLAGFETGELALSRLSENLPVCLIL